MKAEINPRAATKLIGVALIIFLLVQFISAAAISTSVTVIAAPTQTYTSSGNPSGGGSSSSSGGMGVSTSECFGNVQIKETRESDLRYNEYTAFTFTSDFPVYEVQVKGLKNDYDVAIRVEQLYNLSCLITDKPHGDIYRYVNIFSGVQQGGVKIAFKVSNGWLTGGTVVLARWQDGVWKDLPTTITGKDNRYTYYEAISTGFSSFAIVEKFAAAPAPTPQVTVTASQVQPTAQVSFIPEVRDLTMYVILAIVVILLLGAGTVYVLIKRCKKP